jgi:hypothetical protein
MSSDHSPNNSCLSFVSGGVVADRRFNTSEEKVSDNPNAMISRSSTQWIQFKSNVKSKLKNAAQSSSFPAEWNDQTMVS